MAIAEETLYSTPAELIKSPDLSIYGNCVLMFGATDLTMFLVVSV